jgi:hypothetical protein
MSCNCNIANPKCEPCAICTPPGVTGLTTCEPVDPCEGVTIDSTCVIYNGQDFDCINVANGDTLIEVLLSILATYFPPEVCCELEGTISLLTTTTTTTAAPTTTTTSTTTSTSTTTTTTTVAPQAYECCIPFVSTMSGPKLYNAPTNVLTSISIPGFSNGKSIANTVDKLWSFTTTPGEIKEWNFVQSPFSATFSRTITYSTSYIIASLFAINNTTLIGIDYSVIPSRVVSLDITTTTAVVTVLFSLPTNRIAAGNPVYTSTGKLIVLNTLTTATGDSYVTQYSNLTGTLELEIQVLSSQTTSMFVCNGAFYFLENSLRRYILNTTSPYSRTTLPGLTSEIPLSSSTAAKCVTTHFQPASTTTTTTTTFTTTTTTTVAPTFVVNNSIAGCIIIGITGGLSLYTVTSGSFPLAYLQTLTGTQFYGSGLPIGLTVNNGSVAGCIKLYIDNVVYDSVSLPASTTSYPILTLPTIPAILPSTKIKIVAVPGPC